MLEEGRARRLASAMYDLIYIFAVSAKSSYMNRVSVPIGHRYGSHRGRLETPSVRWSKAPPKHGILSTNQKTHHHHHRSLPDAREEEAGRRILDDFGLSSG